MTFLVPLVSQAFPLPQFINIPIPMKDSRKYNVYPTNLSIPSAFKCYRDFLIARGYKGGKIFPIATSSALKFRHIELCWLMTLKSS